MWIYLDQTNTGWQDQFVLHENICVDDKKSADYLIYVVTGAATDICVVANAVSDCHKFKYRVLFCNLSKTEEMAIVEKVLDKNNAKVFQSLEEITEFLDEENLTFMTKAEKDEAIYQEVLKAKVELGERRMLLSKIAEKYNVTVWYVTNICQQKEYEKSLQENELYQLVLAAGGNEPLWRTLCRNRIITLDNFKNLDVEKTKRWRNVGEKKFAIFVKMKELLEVKSGS